jgi:hypothetical protein
MRVRIGENEYDSALLPFIGDLRLLKKEFGFGFATVSERIGQLTQLEDPSPLFDDEDFLDAFVAWLWLMRLRAGERTVTRADIEAMPLDAVLLLGDDSPVPEEPPDPTTARTDSVPGDAKPKRVAKAQTAASTKTSKKPSTPASR